MFQRSFVSLQGPVRDRLDPHLLDLGYFTQLAPVADRGLLDSDSCRSSDLPTEVFDDLIRFHGLGCDSSERPEYRPLDFFETKMMTKTTTEEIFAGMSIGQRLRWVLENREVKQLHLAQKLGIMQSTISNIVTDSARKPSADTLLMLCEELRCSPSWLMSGKGDPFAWVPITAPEQVELIHNWLDMSPENRVALQGMARALAKKQ